MISVSEARALVLANVEAVGVETTPLMASLHRTLREDIIATRAQPPFRASAMDGYALRAADTPGVLRLIGESGAGRALGKPLHAGACARIFTGAPLPQGADSVLAQEGAVRDGDLITAPAVETGRHVRDAGADFKAGDLLLSCGALVDAPAIAIAAAAGRAGLTVSRRPRVAVLSGGDELVRPGEHPADDQIFDSMSVGVAALAHQWGAAATPLGPLADRPGDVSGAIADAVGGFDLIVMVGGASVGDHDHTRTTVRGLGGQLLFEKVALRPGKPTWFAKLGSRPILGLPGNPASAIVCARLFLRPLLDRMCGRDPAPSARAARAQTTTVLPANGPREAYLRATDRVDETGQCWVTVSARQDSSLLSGFAGEGALVVRAPGAAAAPAGALVDVLSL